MVIPSKLSKIWVFLSFSFGGQIKKSEQPISIKCQMVPDMAQVKLSLRAELKVFSYQGAAEVGDSKMLSLNLHNFLNFHPAFTK